MDFPIWRLCRTLRGLDLQLLLSKRKATMSMLAPEAGVLRVVPEVSERELTEGMLLQVQRTVQQAGPQDRLVAKGGLQMNTFSMTLRQAPWQISPMRCRHCIAFTVTLPRCPKLRRFLTLMLPAETHRLRRMHGSQRRSRPAVKMILQGLLEVVGVGKMPVHSVFLIPRCLVQ